MKGGCEKALIGCGKRVRWQAGNRGRVSEVQIPISVFNNIYPVVLRKISNNLVSWKIIRTAVIQY